MRKATVEKAICESCGADVREGTLFCYNCGKRVSDEPSDEDTSLAKMNGEAVDDEIAKRFRVDEDPPKDRLAVAAARRKKARVNRRKPVEIVWEPSDGSSAGIFVAVSIVITVMAAVVVFIALYWK